MGTLKNKAEAILEEKQNKIIPENIKSGVEIFNVMGTAEAGEDTSDATVTERDMLEGATAYARGQKITGNLVDKRDFSGGVLDVTSAEYESQYNRLFLNGYYYPDSMYDDTHEYIVPGKATIGQNLVHGEIIANGINLQSNIIKKGESVLGVTGTLEVGVKVVKNMSELIAQSDVHEGDVTIVYDKDTDELSSQGFFIYKDGTWTRIRVENEE